MTADNSEQPGQLPSPSAEDRLDSWKEIADYLKREVRTVQRWEKSEGLPVHRHQHSKQGTVYAYRSEIDAWWKSREPALETRLDEPAAGGAAAQNRESSLVAQLILGTFALALVAGYLAWQEWSAPPLTPIEKIMLVVLPFENISNDPEQDYLSDGMTEELSTRLGQLNPLRLGVIARTSAMQYKNTNKSVATIGRELGVEYVMEGSVRREGEHLRITAQLIQVADQSHLWAETINLDMTKMFSVWDEVATRIAGALEVELLDNQLAAPARLSYTNPEANDAYLRGRYFLNKRSIEGIHKALDYFQRTLDFDPNHAPAYSGRSIAYSLFGSTGYNILPPHEAIPQIREAARKALAINPTLPEAYTSLAYVTMVYEWDWEAADKALKHAIALNPNSAYTRHWYAYFLTAMGRYEEALNQARIALELDPVSLSINASVGWHLYFAGQYDESIAQLLRTLELDPDFALAHFDLGMVYLQQGKTSQAITELTDAAGIGNDEPLYQAALGTAYAADGQEKEARRILKELKGLAERRYIPALYFAVLNTALGEQNRAFAWLEKAYQERSDYLLYIRVDPLFRSLRSDPRFQELLGRMKFPHTKPTVSP